MRRSQVATLISGAAIVALAAGSACAPTEAEFEETCASGCAALESCAGSDIACHDYCQLAERADEPCRGDAYELWSCMVGSGCSGCDAEAETWHGSCGDSGLGI